MNYNFITHPLTNEKLSIYSSSGKQLLKQYITMYKKGGMMMTEDEEKTARE